MSDEAYPWHVRLKSATRHLDQLQADVDAYLATDPFHVAVQQENVKRVGGVGSYEIAFYASIHSEPPDEISEGVFVVGESLRSCLELVTTALAEKHSGPLSEPQARSVGFPVKLTSEAYFGKNNNEVPRSIRFLEPPAQTVVAQLQPFQGQDPAPRHPLAVLDVLRERNFHRSRLLAVSIGGITNTGITYANGGASLYFPGPASRPPAFRTGDEVQRLQVAINRPDTEMDLTWTPPVFLLSFAPDGPGDGATVMPTLGRIRDHLRDVVFPALEQFA
ncbi:hypothetical protein [Microlunatus antarcticus]|uniref:Uncharacterized protein n=1 Tax=Microlunatus antarcticus TaxID=53388 RepID=A0A7W5JUM5_9ACTN|nr:hypothetical protein [Microlunatus antarcticus]MBB3326381.1 hypothetical protein [Microlunatus antarcticus]